MGRTSPHLDDKLERQIDPELFYGDSKSEWIRHVIKMRQHIDPILDEIYESYQREERLRLVEAAVRKEVDRRKREIENGNGGGGR